MILTSAWLEQNKSYFPAFNVLFKAIIFLAHVQLAAAMRNTTVERVLWIRCKSLQSYCMIKNDQFSEDFMSINIVPLNKTNLVIT